METDRPALQSSLFTLLALRKSFSLPPASHWELQKTPGMAPSLPSLLSLAEQCGKEVLIFFVVQCIEVEPPYKERKLCGKVSV